MNRSIPNLDVGVCKWTDETRYEGDWHDDKDYGIGVHTDDAKYEGK